MNPASTFRETAGAAARPDEAEQVVDLLRARARLTPDRPYVTVCDRTFTFADVDGRSDLIAAGLHALGVRRGDRVAWLLPNRPEIVELYFALAKLGAIQVPLNVYLKGDFLEYPLRQSQASFLVTDAEGAQALAGLADAVPTLRHCVVLDPVGEATTRQFAPGHLVDYADLAQLAAPVQPLAIEPTDTAAIMFTSGTTGSPKGCVLNHGYVRRGVVEFGRGMGILETDTVYTSLPLFHLAAQVSTMLSPLVFGNRSVIDDRFSASGFIARAAEVQATISVAIGAMGQALLATPPGPSDRAHTLRAMVVVPLAPSAQEQFETRFGIEAWSEVYGQTECNPITCTPRVSAERDRAGCGEPTADLEVQLVDEHDRPVPDGEPGEIVVRPRTRFAMFDGYWDMPGETLAAFRNLWYHTGDVGKRLPSGQLAFVDRKKDALRRRGENVSSMEVEAVIVRHPAVAEVAIHAVPSDMSEDDIKACLVLAPGARLEPDEIFAFFREHLPFYAIPRYVELVEALPRTATGRVMKHVLRERPNGDDVWDFDRLGLQVAAAERRTSPTPLQERTTS